MLFYCTDSPPDSISYVYWMEKGVEQKFRVKAPFSMTIRPKLVPKIKPAPDCLAIERIGFTYWDEAFTPRTGEPDYDPETFKATAFIRESSINNAPVLAFPVDPEWFYMDLDPNNNRSIIGYVNGTPIYSTLRRNAGIKVGATNDLSGSRRVCIGKTEQFGIYAFSTINLLDDLVPLEVRLRYQGEIVGGITSIVDFNGDEYVEEVKRVCDLQIFDTSGQLIFSRRIEDCSTVQVVCDGDCPPGTCKCWISRAAKSFCCAKCKGRS